MTGRRETGEVFGRIIETCSGIAIGSLLMAPAVAAAVVTLVAMLRCGKVLRWPRE